MFVKSAVVVALLASFGAAVTSDNSTIEATSVDPTTRSQWCGGQQNTCPVLCGGQSNTDKNDCEVETLKFNCTCSNGTAPGLQYYTSTMPTFICEQIYQNCIVAGQNDAAAQKLCNEAEKKNCGKMDPSKYTPPAETSSSSAESTPSPTGTGAGAAGATEAAPSSTSAAAAATMAIMAGEYGTGLLAAGAAAAFGFLL